MIGGGGANRRLLVEDGHSPEWSPDGCTIAFIGDGLYVVDTDGRPTKWLTRNPPGESAPGAVAAAWSPDGDRIALTLSDEEGPTAAPEQTSYIDVLDSDGDGRRRLVPFQAGAPSWSPDGDRVAFGRYFTIDTSDIDVVDADGRNLRRLTRRSSRSPGSDSPAWSPGDFDPVWAPDGKRIAFVRESDEDVTDVYVVNRDGSGLRRLTHSGDAGEPEWSPDGRSIAFSRGEADLYVVDVEGNGLRRLTKTPRFVEGGPVWARQ